MDATPKTPLALSPQTNYSTIMPAPVPSGGQPVASTSALPTPSPSGEGGAGTARRRWGKQKAAAVVHDNSGRRWWRVAFELENKGSVARDHLASERTYLAWLRTSLSLASIGIAVTQLFRLSAGSSTSVSGSLAARQALYTLPPEITSDPTFAPLQSLLESYGEQIDAIAEAQRTGRYAYLAKPVGGTFIALALLFLILGTTRFFIIQNALMKEPSKFPPSRRSVAISTFCVAAIMSYNYGRASQDSARPLSNVQYGATPQQEPKYEYGAGYSAGNNYPTGNAKGKSKKRWLWWLLAIVAIVVVLAAVLGGVFGSRASDKKNNSANAVGAVSGSSSGTATSGASSTTSKKGSTTTAASGGNNALILPTATDAWGNPLYPTTTGSARISSPSTTTNASLSCGTDPYTFAGSLTVRDEHPLLFAPSYKWTCVREMIAKDHYLSYWNDTIFINATLWYDAAPINYTIDGGLSGSGVLDPAMETQLRFKHWGYAWKMTNDTKWVDRAWQEILVVSGNSTTQYFGETGDNWNSAHFLDLAEFLTGFAIAYDWMYEAWTADQRTAIMWSMITLGLDYGYNALADPSGAGAAYSWWSTVNGNWNCRCNGGMIIGALAIMNEDPTGVAGNILPLALASQQTYCSNAPSSDGTWSETANYWYFGTSQHSMSAAALLSATGSTQGLLDNAGMKLSALFHMYVTGMQGLFAYGDTGPNKYAATANGIMFYGQQYNLPVYTLFQRDRSDAPEPMSMLYYDPQVTGEFWDGLALDHHFPNTTNGWASMRSSWTTTQGMYIAMKAGALLGHQTHGDLDVGDFVLDALGQRWAGELGSADYLGLNYFSNETQGSERWYYFRKRTEGQNTLLLNLQNQNVSTVPTTTFNTTGETQDALDYTAPNSSTAYFIADMETAYMTPAMRGIRFLNGRRQVLLQDEITVPTGETVQWRIQTNATITLTNNNQTATLELGGETLQVQIQSPSTAVFFVQADARYASDPVLPSDSLSQDQDNSPAQVLTIELAAGDQVIEVLFNPQWSDFSANDFITPASVALADWTLTSHDA
ncbi:heparinase II/III family protein [Pseudohyphozyma bogoriensis]|nr:heparinase II/III family protein [Pseudohyphozyma bogoriensis]